MSEGEAVGGTEPITELECHESHPDGHVSAAWLGTDAQVLAVVTAGRDGMLARRQFRPPAEPKTTRMTKGDAGINVMELNADSTMAVIGVNSTGGSDVKLVDLTGDFVNPDESKKITRFKLPVHCCCFSKDGKGLLVGSDDGLIKLCTVPKGSHSSKVAIQIRTSTSDTASLALSPASLRAVALDPEFKYAAAVSAAGEVWVWELTGGDKPSAKEDMKKKIAPEVDHMLEPAIRQGLAWHPDGTFLAVAGKDNDVVLLERFNWHPSDYLTGGHTGPVRAIAFSPNGLYAATAGADCRVVVWLVDSRMQVAVRQLPSPASSLAWHPSANLLLCGTTAGGYALWPKTVPTDQYVNKLHLSCVLPVRDANLPSPYKPIDEVERDADVVAAARAAAAADADDDDGLEDEDGGAVVKRRGLKKTAAAPQDSAAAPRDEFDDMFDQLDAVMEEAEVEAGRTTAALNPTSRGSLYPASTLAYGAPKPKQPQAPIQPGSTPEGGDDAEVAARFLAYNKLGWVVSKAGDGQNYIEVSFRDSSKGRLQPKLVDLYGFTAASLGPSGVAYISPAAGEDRPGMLMFRSFESWSGEREWTVALPAGEEALVVAAGSSVVAIATNKQKLRLYSCAGRQLAILSLQGPPVALVAAGACAAGAAGAACAHQLAVVWARGPPEPLNNTQQLDYMVLDVSNSSKVASGGVVLSAGTSLTWLAFSQEGLLAAMDSVGTLRIRTPDWGGSWVPVLDAAAAKGSAGSDSLWPVFLDASHLTAVVTSKKAPHPQVLPHPINTQVPLALPGAPAEAASALEDQLLLQGLLTAHVTALSTSACDAEGVSAELEASKVSADRLAIKAFRDYVAGDKQGRALELLDSMHLIQSLEGALKLSQHYKRHQLAERVQQVIEQRLEWEEQQQEAAAAQQAGYLQEADPGWAAAAAGGDENDMQVQQDQASQFPAGNSSGSKPADGRSSAQAAQAAGAKVPAMFGAAAAAGGASGSGGGSFAGVKRKPTVAAAGFGGKAGAGPNPFARKKAK